MEPVKPNRLLDNPKSQKRFRKGFYLSLCLLLVLDFFAWFVFDRHGHFAWEEVPFFNAAYGFVACVALIFVAKVLRFIVRRKEGYYD